jgi:CD2 antigen cytoplasmic tail-binding protein 2
MAILSTSLIAIFIVREFLLTMMCLQDNNEDTPNEFSEKERKEIYESLLEVLQPNETVAKALRRVGGRGGDKLSAAEERKRRWAAKKAGSAVQLPGSDTQIETLTGLADKLVSNGEFEAYQFTYEKIKFLLDGVEERATKLIVAADKDLDMFAESTDAANATPIGPEARSSSASQSTDTKRLLQGLVEYKIQNGFSAEPMDQLSVQVQWEYKWSMDEGANVVGPISTELMIEQQSSGFFKAGAWARKFGALDAPFYSTRRIDFDLYT